MVFQSKKFAHRKSEVRKYGAIALPLDSSELSENRVRHLSSHFENRHDPNLLLQMVSV